MRQISSLFGGIVLLLVVGSQTAANYIFSTSELRDLQNVPTLANGNLAFIAYSDTIHLSGLFNGAGIDSHRARIPNYGRVQFEYCGVSTLPDPQCEYSLNVRQGLFRTSAVLGNGSHAVELVTFPHRVYERTIFNQLKVNRLTNEMQSYLVRLFASPGSNSADLNLTGQYSGSVHGVNYIVYELQVNEPEDPKQSNGGPNSVFVIDQDVPESVTLPSGQTEFTAYWITTVGQDFYAALAEFTEVVLKRNASLGTHVAEWERFWVGSGITVDGNDELADVIHCSLYALASSMPAQSPYSRDQNRSFGVSPAGLGDDLYEGHSTWDSEMWLLPTALLLEPKWSEQLLQYRFAKRDGAAASASKAGFSGLAYPVRSAGTGYEVSANPEQAKYTQHISGDVAFAVKQHFLATLDREWFERVGCGLTLDTAAFWRSRATLNKTTQRFDINDVIGPDTTHGPKDNNAYTNVLAAINLYFAEFAACYCPNRVAAPRGVQSRIARSIDLPYASDYTPTYEGFSSTTKTQEADAILISYPLRYELARTTQQNNLRIYEENLLNQNVPSTTFAVHNIIRLGLGGEPDYNQFYFSYHGFVRGPFNLWSKFEDGKLVVRNYVSGAGAFLQQIINGYAGVRLLDDGLLIEAAKLPPLASSLSLNGIKYLKGTYSIQISFARIVVKIITRDPNTEFLVNGVVQEPINAEFTFPRESGSLRLRPRENSFGNCKLEVSTIGNAVDAPNNYILNATKSVDLSNLPTLANGNLAFIVYSDTIYLNGVFSGIGAQSRRARIPNYGRVQFEFCGPFSLGAGRCSFEFDIRRGVFRTQSHFKGNSFAVELLTFPHRSIAGTVVNRLKINRLTAERSPFLVRLFASPGSNSADLNITRQQRNSVDGVEYILYELSPVSKENVLAADRNVFVLSQKVPEAVTLPEGSNELIVTWVTTFSINLTTGTSEFREAIQKNSELLREHEAQWNLFWTNSGISVDGDDELAQTIHSSLYALASAFPSPANAGKYATGLSPAGISEDYYQGHTLWDTEIWMQPPALLLEPKWSEQMLQYRFDRKSAAAENAALNGLVGLMYPIRSGDLGNEVSANIREAAFEQHVSGDVAFAVKQHLLATLDTDWFQRVGCNLAIDTGKFWERVAVFNTETERYDILNITGPDASHSKKNNNAYTNVLAAYNLFFAEFASCFCDDVPNSNDTERLFKLARSITLPHVNESDYTPAYQGFLSNTPTREAETILLSYPLHYPLNVTTQRNNLRVYAANLDTTGDVPSTTYAVQNIVRLGLGEIPSVVQFERSYKPYVRSDFKLWTQLVQETTVVRNHVAGAAGFLQQIMNGYAGIRLLDDGLEIRNAVLPPGTTKLVLSGIKYLGGTFSIEIQSTNVVVVIVNRTNAANILVNGQIHDQQISRIMSPRSGGSIRIVPRSAAFGECTYKTTTIGHRNSAPLVAGSLTLLAVSLLSVMNMF